MTIKQKRMYFTFARKGWFMTCMMSPLATVLIIHSFTLFIECVCVRMCVCMFVLVPYLLETVLSRDDKARKEKQNR